MRTYMIFDLCIWILGCCLFTYRVPGTGYRVLSYSYSCDTSRVARMKSDLICHLTINVYEYVRTYIRSANHTINSISIFIQLGYLWIIFRYLDIWIFIWWIFFIFICGCPRPASELTCRASVERYFRDCRAEGKKMAIKKKQEEWGRRSQQQHLSSIIGHHSLQTTLRDHVGG